MAKDKIGLELAGKVGDIYAELRRKGLKHQEAVDLAHKIGTAALSSSNGCCLPAGVGAKVNPAAVTAPK